MNTPIYQRFTQDSLLDALQDTPVVLIHGSRQCGKTTLAQLIGERHGYHYITLDDDNSLVIEVKKGQGLNDLFSQFEALGITVTSMRNKSNRLEEMFISMVENNLERTGE